MKDVDLPFTTIEHLRDIAYEIAGEPQKVEFGDRVVSSTDSRRYCKIYCGRYRYKSILCSARRGVYNAEARACRPVFLRRTYGYERADF